MKRMIRSNTTIQAATYVQRLIRKRPQKDKNGEPLIYSGSGGRSLVGINYDSIDKFSSKEAAEENLQKTAKNLKEWEVVEYTSISSAQVTSSESTTYDTKDVHKLAQYLWGWEQPFSGVGGGRDIVINKMSEDSNADTQEEFNEFIRANYKEYIDKLYTQLKLEVSSMLQSGYDEMISRFSKL